LRVCSVEANEPSLENRHIKSGMQYATIGTGHNFLNIKSFMARIFKHFNMRKKGKFTLKKKECWSL
jgi:hypothetical protein